MCATRFAFHSIHTLQAGHFWSPRWHFMSKLGSNMKKKHRKYSIHQSSPTRIDLIQCIAFSMKELMVTYATAVHWKLLAAHHLSFWNLSFHVENAKLYWKFFLPSISFLDVWCVFWTTAAWRFFSNIYFFSFDVQISFTVAASMFISYHHEKKPKPNQNKQENQKWTWRATHLHL